MASVNRAIIIGHLGADPEIKNLPSGQAVCEISLACNETWTDKAGQKQERVEWVRCVLWGKQAEATAKYMRKGGQLYVEGSLRTDSWDDKETGQKRYATKVQAQKVVFLGGGERRDGDDQRTQQRAPTGGGGGGGAPAREYTPSDFGPGEEDIPFACDDTFGRPL